MTVRSYIGLGSNLGDSEQILREAVEKLATLGSVQASRLYLFRRLDCIKAHLWGHKINHIT